MTLGVFVALVIGWVAVTPGRLGVYGDAGRVLGLHPDREATRAGIHNAVVVIPDGWGTRLIVRMWALGIPVRRSPRLYAAMDACRLQLALDEAERNPERRAALSQTLDSLAGLGQPGVSAGITEDPHLRLPPPGEALPLACARELAVDRRGFLAFAPFLWLNTAFLDGDIVWARDLGPRNTDLFARYPDRQYFRYGPATPDGRPVFTPLESP